MEPMLTQAQVALSQAPKLPNTQGGMDLKRVREVAQDFEAVFLSQMLQPMFQGLGAEAPFGGGNAEEMWRSMMVDEYGKSIAKAGGIGIADAVMREMLKAQEVR